MERHIAIIGAMDEEVEALSQSLTSAALESSPFQDLPVFTGYLADQKARGPVRNCKCMPPLLPNT